MSISARMPFACIEVPQGYVSPDRINYIEKTVDQIKRLDLERHQKLTSGIQEILSVPNQESSQGFVSHLLHAIIPEENPKEAIANDALSLAHQFDEQKIALGQLVETTGINILETMQREKVTPQQEQSLNTLISSMERWKQQIENSIEHESQVLKDMAKELSKEGLSKEEITQKIADFEAQIQAHDNVQGIIDIRSLYKEVSSV